MTTASAPQGTQYQYQQALSFLESLPEGRVADVLDKLLKRRRASLSRADRAAQVRELAWLQNLDRSVQQHLNSVSESVYDGRHPKHWVWRSHKQWILDRVRPGERVLDVGCGASAYLLWMAQKGCRVTACDINPKRIEQARGLMSHPNLRFEVRDVTRDVPAEPYDVSICSHVIEHLDDPVSMLAALRSNAPRLLVAVPPDDNRWQKVMFRELGLLWKDDEDHRREYTAALLRKQVEAAGWRVVDLHAGVDIKAECAVAGA